MPRSFLITNKRYRCDAVVTPVQQHQPVTSVTPSEIHFRLSDDVTESSSENLWSGPETETDNSPHRGHLAIADDDTPKVSLNVEKEAVEEEEEEQEEEEEEEEQEEEALVKLYQQMKNSRLNFAFLPELFLSTSGPMHGDASSPSSSSPSSSSSSSFSSSSSSSSSSLSPKSLFYGFASDQSGDETRRKKRDVAESGQFASDAVHSCPECGKAYSTTSNLARHRQTHRSADDKKARKCPHCDKLYVSSPAFSMHVRTHNQGCACPHCGKRFSRPWLLQGHIRTHTGEKPFECPKCGKTFADKSNLRAHIQTHSSEKPYVCGRCGKGFALKSYLYKHEESSCMRSHRLYHQTPFHTSIYHHHHHHPTSTATEVF